MSLTFQPIITDADLDVIAALAREIWQEFYVPIIGQAQVDYMVPKFQSRAAMREQILDGYEYYMIREAGVCVGYAAIKAQRAQRTLFLSKFYLAKAARGSGSGRAAMNFLESLARLRELTSIWLTVNKDNPSIRVYERLGFINEGSVVMDIGNGFIMDDFKMRKTLA